MIKISTNTITRCTILLSLLFSILSLQAKKENKLDSLLLSLDRAIENKSIYSQIREDRIDSLKVVLSKATSNESKYELYRALYREYRSYNMDFALEMAKKKLEIANKLQNIDLQNESKMNMAEILGIMGMYKETFDILDDIPYPSISKDEKTLYYHVHHSTYSLLYENAQTQQEKAHYNTLINLYKDSLLLINPPNTLVYMQIKSQKLIEQQKYDEAYKMLKQCYQMFGSEERNIGTLGYSMSEYYYHIGDYERQKQYLAISAISDIKRAVKGYISLRKLAVILYEDGDIDRAYTYIRSSMEDATFCKARFRTLQISETLPIIVAAYDKKTTEEKKSLVKYLILISILSLFLFISFIYIYKQLKHISQTRKELKQLYLDTKEMNTVLSDLNTKLSESNLVKEEYIASIFNLCSSYIDKMEGYRVDINRKLMTGQVKEATQATSSTSFVSDELKDFFKNFDAIFLSLFPNFVEEFNAMLLEEEQIIPRKGDILTAELRVFALVRLGISDSSKIASFLHYSPQTVYNYNLKVRNKLAISKEEFAEKIQRIGK